MANEVRHYFPNGTEDSSTRLLEREKFNGANLSSILKQGQNFFPSKCLDDLKGYDFSHQCDSTTVLFRRDFWNPFKTEPLATGVVVNYNSRDYLVTASHAIELSSEADTLDSKSLATLQTENLRLSESRLIYSRPHAYQQDMPIADVAIFELPYSRKGVEIGELDDERNIALGISYPGCFSKEWLKDSEPLVGFGYAKLMNEPEEYQFTFTGASEPGSSGGGVFNLEGKILGIHIKKNVSTLLKPVFDML